MSSTTDPDLVTRTQHFLDDLDAEPGGGAPAVLDDGLGFGPDDEYDPDDEYGPDDDEDGAVAGYGDDELTAIVPRAAGGEEADGAEGFAPTPGYDPEPRSGVDPDDGAESDLGVDPDYNLGPDPDGEDYYSSPAETTAFLEPAPDPDPDEALTDDHADAAPARFSRPVVIGFIALTIVVAIGLSAAMLAMRPTNTVVSDQPSALAPQVSVVSAAPSPTAAPDPNSGADAPIPFTASADCPLGSTAAQAVAGSDRTRAWVCVRAGADGQVLTLDLGRPMKVTAITIVPGWVGADTSGADQWLQHRVVTRVQWILINGDQRIAVPQNTNNVHGEAVQQMPGSGPDRGVLASQIQMIVQQTSRAPADTPAPSSTPGMPDQGGGQLTDVLGGPLGAPSDPSSSSTPSAPLGGPDADSANADPADNTFAVSSIKVIGHLPQ